MQTLWRVLNNILNKIMTCLWLNIFLLLWICKSCLVRWNKLYRSCGNLNSFNGAFFFAFSFSISSRCRLKCTFFNPHVEKFYEYDGVCICWCPDGWTRASFWIFYFNIYIDKNISTSNLSLCAAFFDLFHIILWFCVTVKIKKFTTDGKLEYFFEA